jgi:hypothetical protein
VTYSLVPHTCIVKHAATLTALAIGVHQTNMVTHHLPARLTYILNACSKLEELAVHINIPIVKRYDSLCNGILQPPASHLGRDIIAVSLLKIIASHPTLYALRILDPPLSPGITTEI